MPRLYRALPMVQSLSVFCVIVSTDEPHAPLLSVATTVTCPVAPGAVAPPVPLIVIMTPGVVPSPNENPSACRIACDGSERLHVAGHPSLVTAGMENVRSVSPGMNDEYIGENTIGIVGLVHVPVL